MNADAMIERLKEWDTNDATDKALYNFALNRVLEAPTVEPERKSINLRVEKISKHQSDFSDLDAQPERKKGKWIKFPVGWKCSNCTLGTNDRGADSFNFCPNCGADMRGEGGK